MNYYIGDTHFGHRNVLKHDSRPFATIEEMDEELIRRWNARVTADDDVFIIGDFSYKSRLDESYYLQHLAGRKHLIIGNHDMKLMQNAKALALLESVDKMRHVADSGKQICLCHFPIADWNGARHGHWHIYGHLHGRTNDVYRFMRSRGNCINAGCMINNYQPATIDELIRNNEIFDEAVELGDTGRGNL